MSVYKKNTCAFSSIFLWSTYADAVERMLPLNEFEISNTEPAARFLHSFLSSVLHCVVHYQNVKCIPICSLSVLKTSYRCLVLKVLWRRHFSLHCSAYLQSFNFYQLTFHWCCQLVKAYCSGVWQLSTVAGYWNMSIMGVLRDFYVVFNLFTCFFVAVTCILPKSRQSTRA